MNKNEFVKSLLDGKATEFWKSKSKEYIKKELGEAVSLMKGYNQNNQHHCYTLMEHCLRSVDNLGDYGERNAILRTAAFFHDMGKPLVAREKDGHFVFYGHAPLSAKMVVLVLRRLGFNNAEIEDIEFLIYHHDDFINYVLEENYIPGSGKIAITESSIKSYLDKIQENYNKIDRFHLQLLIKELIILSIADVSAQSIMTIRNGKMIDSRAGKIARMNRIAILVNTLYVG